MLKVLLLIKKGGMEARLQKARSVVLVLLLSLGVNLGFNIGAVLAVPPAPTGVSATGISDRAIKVSWTDSLTNEQSFDVQASWDGVNWSSFLGGTEQGDVTTGTDDVTHSLSSSPWPNRFRVYRVRARDSTGFSNWSLTSNRAYTWVLTPNAPTVTNVGSTSVDVKLTLPDGNPQTSSGDIRDTEYAIRDTVSGQTLVAFISLWDGSFTTKRVNVEPCTTYKFVAVARNGEYRESSPSSPTAFTTGCTAPPKNFGVQGTTESTISVRWEPGGGNETTYELYLSRLDGAGYDLDGTVAVDGSAEYFYTYTNADQVGSTLQSNGDYSVYVTAVGPNARKSSATLGAATSPSQISLSYANLTTNSVDLSINYNGNSDDTLYEIQVKTKYNIYWLGGSEIGSGLPRWQTAAQWPNPHSVSLQNGIEYTFTPHLKSLSGEIITGTPLLLSPNPVNPTPPTGSITINAGNLYTTTADVILSLTYNDPDDGVDVVRYSNDGIWDDEPWEVPTMSKLWTLSPLDGTKTVYYQIKDNRGAVSVPFTDMIILDTTPPVITVLGLNPVTVIQGDPYVDAGATASDNLDGDITSRIVTTNPVNTAVVGPYTVTYEVSDTAGNAVAMTRDVNVVTEIIYEDGSDGNTNPWFINPSSAAGAIQNVVDEDPGHGSAIELSGAITNSTRMVFYAPVGNPWAPLADYPLLEWDMKYGNQANILIMLKTSNMALNNGYQYLSYAAVNTEGLRGNKVYYRLDPALADGNWHTVSRNLQQDLETYLPGTVIERIWYFSIYGNGRLDNLKLSQSTSQ